jgi:hypothetical protein
MGLFIMVALKKYVGAFFNFWEIGQGKVLGRVSGALTLCLSFLTWLAVSGFNTPSWFLFVLLVIIGFFIVGSGFFYVRFGLYRAEIRTLCVVNPFNREVLERLERIEGKLK